jgi:hypothetical protein
LRKNADLQFPALIHLHHDVEAADEFAFDVELGDGGQLLYSLIPARISASSSTFTAVIPLVYTLKQVVCVKG